MMKESLITRAPNGMAYDFMQSDATHLMFIDADISFKPADIVRMIDADKDIICGLYPKKEINWQLVSNAVKSGVDYKDLANYTGSFVVNLVGGALETTGDINHPMEIDNGGTGFMLIKREVFEKLKESVGHYTNGGQSIPEGEKVYDFFQVAIHDGLLLSEDFWFCHKWREVGGTVWAAPWCELGHFGSDLFSGQYSQGQ
jgi:hypothetical protein